MTTTQVAARTGSAPRWTGWVASAAITWALLYGALRLLWAVTDPPVWEVGTDLLVAGWPAVALCVAAAVTVLALTARPRWSLVWVAWAVAGLQLASGGLLLLDLVGTALPGLGIPFQPVAIGSRLGAVAGAVLVGLTALTQQRRLRGGCPSCGRIADAVRPAATPAWAWYAAYAAAAGCVIRLVAQAVVGWGDIPYNGGLTLALFEIGFVLAGTFLPLGLVHRYGRVFPFWVVGLAGRPVPRWLPLGPGIVLGAGITAYFGSGLAGMVADAVRGIPMEADPLPVAFFWVAVPAYLLWGVGLLLAAISYGRLTRPACTRCERG